MKNTKGFTLIELAIVIVIIIILASIAIPHFINMNKKDEPEFYKNDKETKFSQDSLYSKEKYKMKEVSKEVPKEVKKELLFHAKLMGKMSCDSCLGNLKVFEFCYNGVKYFVIDNGYMAPKMIKAANGVVHHETCD